MDVEIALPASKTKTGKARDILIGGKLVVILEMRAYTPDGTKLGPDAYVFGNEVGEQIKSTRKSWTTCVLRAHGHEPTWVKGRKNQLTAESRSIYRANNVKLHDLRRECASRMLEAGCSLVEVRDILGHSDISQTSTYLASPRNRWNPRWRAKRNTSSN